MIDSEKMREFAETVVSDLTSAGYQALWAGGCVRDQKRQESPKDYDIATNATPDQVRTVFGHNRTIAIGEAFGVITVIGSKTTGNIEVATFRADASYSDGRRPDSVRFTDAKEDALRRDFTINGMFFDPINQQYIDFVNGEADIKAKLIRAIGDPHTRIEEDRLRMLRAIRFASTFDFEIEADTYAAVQANANKISAVSSERILLELSLILNNANRKRGLRLLQQGGLLQHIIPGITTARIESEPESWTRLLDSLHRLTKSPLETSLALIWTTIGEREWTSSNRKELEVLQRHMKLSNDSIKTINWVIASLPKILTASTEFWPKIQEILIDPRSDCLMNTAFAVAEGEDQHNHIRFCQDMLDQPIEKLNPPPLLDGNIILQHQLATGKEIGRLLKAVRDAQLLGEITTTSEAISYVESVNGGN